jgi:hypothetical protein
MAAFYLHHIAAPVDTEDIVFFAILFELDRF